MGKFILLLLIIFAIWFIYKLYKKDSTETNPYKDKSFSDIEKLEKFFNDEIDKMLECTIVDTESAELKIKHCKEELIKIKQIKNKLENK